MDIYQIRVLNIIFINHKNINFKNQKLWVEAKLILIEKHEFECEEPDLI